MSDKVGEEVRAIVVKEVRSAILEATAPLQSHIEKLEDINADLLAACKEALEAQLHVEYLHKEILEEAIAKATESEATND